jgi:integrase/recombinase XerC
MNIAESVRRFITAKTANGRAPATISDYHRCLEPFAAWCDSHNLDTSNLDRDDFRRYIADELRSNGWAQNTVGIHISVLRCFLSWIHDEGYTDDDLAQAVEAPRKTERIEEPLTSGEVRAILAACRGDRWALRDRAIILVLLDTGLRRGETSNLKRDDVIFTGDFAYIKTVDPKSKRLKISVLGNTTTETVRQYLDSREDDDPALWMGRWGPLTGEGIYNVVDKRAGMAGIDRAHPQLFRKTFATHWTRNGGDQDRLMDLGGWNDPSTLRIYVLLGSIPDLVEGHQQFGPVDNML